jgi:hypothetical protein
MPASTVAAWRLCRALVHPTLSVANSRSAGYLAFPSLFSWEMMTLYLSVYTGRGMGESYVIRARTGLGGIYNAEIDRLVVSFLLLLSCVSPPTDEVARQSDQE